jgi:hypothetical protein
LLIEKMKDNPRTYFLGTQRCRDKLLVSVRPEPSRDPGLPSQRFIVIDVSVQRIDVLFALSDESL